MTVPFVIPGPRAPKAAHSWWLGQRGAVLPRVGQHVLRPQLPQPEPLEHPTDPRAQGRAGARPARLRAHGDRAHTDQPTQNGKLVT